MQQFAPHLLVEQFSYAGVDGRGRPVPHTGEATDADLAVVAGLMADQLDSLARRTGRPVAVVAESEGTLVMAEYLRRHPDAPIDRLMLLSPIVHPGRVNFPDPGLEGRGIVAGAQLRIFSEFIDELAPFSLTVDGPLGDSVRRDAAALQEASFCDRPGIEEIAIIPVADAVTTPPGSDYPIDVLFLPGFHGGLRGRTDVREMVVDWVSGAELHGSTAWSTIGRLIADSASAWQVPALDGFALWELEPDCPA
jgi:pimeloyl-ACP methyl ester carboxylesterase